MDILKYHFFLNWFDSHHYQNSKNIDFYLFELKKNPINDNDLEDFIEFSKTKCVTEKSWKISISAFDEKFCDLSVKNPNKKELNQLREPEIILDEIFTLQEENNEIMNLLNNLIENNEK